MNWIQARFDCSPDHVIRMLRERVKADIEEWKKLAGPHSQVKLTMKESRTEILRPTSSDERDGRWVTFEFDGDSLLIRKGNNRRTNESQVKKHTLTPTVDFEGRCRFKIGAQERELWQVSQLVLEDLLFNDLEENAEAEHQ